MTCPCGSQLSYSKCCEPYHKGTPAPTPEALLRSRYSGYAKNLPSYIMATTHPANRTPSPEWEQEISLFSQSTLFAKLTILSSEPGEPEAFITFRVTLYQGNRDASFTEKSRFVHENGQWLYHSAASL